MRLLMLRNRWVSHLGCVVLGIVLCAGVWATMDAWREAKLRQSLYGRWTLEGAHADPAIRQVDAEYRPDGTFMVWQTTKDGSIRIVEHGRWWVSGRRLLEEYDTLEGRPVPTNTPTRPAAMVVVRADQTLVLVWPAGHQCQFRRAAG